MAEEVAPQTILPFLQLIEQVNSDISVLDKARKEGTTPENIGDVRENAEKVRNRSTSNFPISANVG